MSAASSRAVRNSTVMLTHYGRKSGKPYRVKIWFVTIDGKVWIGSLSQERGWVKNIRANGRGELDFGSERHAVRCRWLDDRDVERFGVAINRKYWILGPVLRTFFPGKRCAFETDLAASPA